MAFTRGHDYPSSSPHDQTRLILCDTSQQPEFSALIRQWAAVCDYSDVRVLQIVAGSTGLADKDRRNVSVRRQVRLAMAWIYNRMICELNTETAWIIEDDVIPPLNAGRRLFEGFDKYVASVALLARSPYHKEFIAWDEQNRIIEQPGTGLASIGGNGFCCVMLRRSVLRRTRFMHLGRNGDFNAAF